jgi:hypothetical protein
VGDWIEDDGSEDGDGNDGDDGLRWMGLRLVV